MFQCAFLGTTLASCSVSSGFFTVCRAVGSGKGGCVRKLPPASARGCQGTGRAAPGEAADALQPHPEEPQRPSSTGLWADVNRAHPPWLLRSWDYRGVLFYTAKRLASGEWLSSVWVPASCEGVCAPAVCWGSRGSGTLGLCSSPGKPPESEGCARCLQQGVGVGLGSAGMWPLPCGFGSPHAPALRGALLARLLPPEKERESL